MSGSDIDGDAFVSAFNRFRSLLEGRSETDCCETR